MAGYGGQLVALDVDNGNGFNIANPLEEYNKIQQGQANVAGTQAQTAGLQAQTANTAAELPAIQAKGVIAGNTAQLNTLATQSALIADAASKVDPSDPNAASKWDAAMSKAKSQGADDAGQFIGKYNSALQNRIVGAYSAATAPEAAAATQGGGLPTSPMSAQQEGITALQLNAMPPEKIQALAQNFGALRDAATKVLQSSNPAQTWDEQAAALGHPDWVGRYSPLQAAQLYNDATQHYNYLQQRLTDTGAGLPAPIVPHDTKVLANNDRMVSIDPYGNAKVVVGAGPKTAVSPTGDYYDENSAPPVAGGPGSSAAGPSIAGFVAKLIPSENSTGNPGAKNPLSSATGDGQFINSTWLQTIKENRPDLVQGKTDAQILAMRSDPQLSSEMTTDLAVKNAGILKAANTPVSGTTLAMAHKLGPGGVQTILPADTGATLGSILPAAVITANPTLKNLTVGQYISGLNQNFGSAPITIGAPANLTGDSFLSTLKPAYAAQVKAYANGDLEMPSGRAATSPLGQKILNDVMQYDPNASKINMASRVATRQAFLKGAQGQNITSINTVLGHADQLYQDINALSNSPVPLWNATAQTLGEAVGNPQTNAALAGFNSDKKQFADEMTKALRGSGGAEGDVKYWLAQLDAAKSPDALHSVVEHSANLLASRLGALTSSYNTGMGTVGQTVPGITPEAHASLNKIQGYAAARRNGPPSAEAISALKAKPTLAPAFDAKYGPGASKAAMGGG